jgi:manganese/zinc/iron transport system permease protein
LAAIIGAASGGIGAVASALDTDLPTGPMIIIVVSLFVAVSLLFAPGRGVVWRAVRRRQDRVRFATGNVLKTAYHYAMSHGDAKTPVSESFIRGVVGPVAANGIRRLGESHDLGETDDGYVLTDRGVERAQREAPWRGSSEE